jgi:outer membrane protein OmpA-like peptidoglycan-associated protein
MKRILIITLIIISCLDSSGQRKMTKTYYKNGQLESAGFLYKYPIFYDVKMPPKMQKSGDIEKRGKVWKYWYQNGQLSRIEKYKFIQDKNPYDLPNGNWTYFNEQGVKYREDTYLNGILINSVKEIYKDSQPVGEITLKNGISDTTLLAPLTSEKNFVLNPEFDYFYYKPVPVIYDGRSRIDDWIPFWVAPGNFTPDYLSNLRTINVLSNYYLFDFPLPEKFSYAGLGLYREGTPYSEYIQGKLIKPLLKGQKYCIRVSIALPSYSGFSEDRLAFHLSPDAIAINESNESSFLPQVILSTLTVDNKRFVTLCDYFVAEGGEQFISIGRFTSPDKLKIIRRENIPQSQFGIEESAYYLLDNVDLHEIQDTMECYCKNNIIQNDTVSTIPVKDIPMIETDLNKLKPGNSVILKNVNFEFNSYVLQPDADTILKTLLTYLIDNPGIRIIISGHTDDTGSEQYNLELSINRAKSVYNWLINNGIESGRLEFTGFGKSRPLFKDTDEKSKTLNRRVEVKIPDNF